MQKIDLITKFTAILFLIIMVWVAYEFTALASIEHSNDNLDYIPKNTSFVVRIDGRNLMKSSSSSILFSEDEEVIQLLKDAAERQGTDEIDPVGISFNSDIIVFHMHEQEYSFLGILYNLTNQRLFDKNIKEYLDENQVSASNERVGLMLSVSGKNTPSRKQLQRHANNIISKKSGFDVSSLKESDDTGLIYSWTGSANKGNNPTKMIFSVQENQLRIDGTIRIDNQNASRNLKRLQIKGVQATSSYIPPQIQDSLTSLTDRLHIPRMDIIAASVNYYGLKIIVDPVFFPAPKFDALLHLNNSYDLNAAIDTMIAKGEVSRISANCVDYSGLHLYYEQIDTRTIFIGVSEDYALTTWDSQLLFQCTGTPQAITNIEGGGMMRRIFEMAPAYTSSRNLVKHIDAIDMKLIQSESGEHKIDGSIKFTLGDPALNTMLKFLIGSQLLE